MLANLPTYLSVLFSLVVLTTIIWFYIASKSKTALALILGWTIIQSAIAFLGGYQDTTSLPPKIMLFGLVPSFGFIALVLFTKTGKAFADTINLKTLTYFHSIRIPVEIILSLLFYQGVVSIWMTMEGSNFDVLSGLSAAIIAFIAFREGKIKRKLLLIWNIICLLLLLNVVITALLSMESPFQQISFDQATVAPFYFPFVLLPTVVVPLVIFSHLVAIKSLLKK